MGQLRMALPKGRIFNNVKQLILDSGFSMTHNSREYKPVLSDRDISLKIMKPQNVAELVSLGFHDAGFTGYDWVIESGADVEILLKTGFDPVSIVSAMPSSFDEKVLLKDNPVVATEYVNMTRRYMDEKAGSYRIIRSYGATEAFPPCDAQMIVDNTSTGETLRRHGLRIIETLLESETLFVCRFVYMHIFQRSRYAFAKRRQNVFPLSIP